MTVSELAGVPRWASSTRAQSRLPMEIGRTRVELLGFMLRVS